MFKKARKFLSLILSVVLLSTATVQPLSAAAIQEPSIELQWNNVANISMVINPTVTPLNVRVTITGWSGTSYSNGTVTLEKTSGTGVGVVKEWEGISGSGPILQFSDYAGTPTSGTYKLTVTITATRNGVSEIVSAYSEVTC